MGAGAGGIWWWLNPWHRSRYLCDRIVELALELDATRSHLAQEQAGRREAEERAARLSAPPSGPGKVTGQIDFILIGMDRPPHGKRVYASKDVAGAIFGQTPAQDQPTRWTLSVAGLAHMLIIDKPGYRQALDHLMTVWGNQAPGYAEGKAALQSSPPALASGESATFTSTYSTDLEE